jgi:hypothetical protein
MAELFPKREALGPETEPLHTTTDIAKSDFERGTTFSNSQFLHKT